MGVVSDLLLIIIIVVLVLIFYPNIITTIHFLATLVSNLTSNFNFPSITNNQSQPNVNSGPMINYTLKLINKDRATYGLNNITLSATTSGQQHADGMLQDNYFSHWDIYGMKPYMRYTLVGGHGAVQENVAYTNSGFKTCIGSLCENIGNINVTASLSQMEHSMFYNDSICCNNGHRDNILDPNHNQVSIGVAYNSTSIYLVEDFVNNYISWLNNTPKINSAKEVVLEGSINSTYGLSSIQMGFDPPITNMSSDQLDQTSEYSYGPAIAGITSSPLDYYPSLTTIVADTYYTKGNDFFVSFNMSKLIAGNGAGEYTIMVWLNGTARNSSFLGSTYTIFVNSSDELYTPPNV